MHVLDSESLLRYTGKTGPRTLSGPSTPRELRTLWGPRTLWVPRTQWGPRTLGGPRTLYIQLTILNTYFSTKLSFTKKRHHLHVLKKCLYVLQVVRSIIHFRQLIDPLSLRSRGRGTSFAFTSYIIVLAKFCDVTFLNNFYFVLFFYHFFICRRQRKIRLVTLSKSYLYKFFFWSFFLLKLTFNKTI